MSAISHAALLRQQRSALVDEIRGILNSTDAAGRDLTRTELGRVQSLEARANKIDRDLADVEQRIGMPPQMRVGDERSLITTPERRVDHRDGYYLTETLAEAFDRRNLSRSPNPAGGYTVDAGRALGFFDGLRSDAPVLRAGVEFVDTEAARITLPKISADISASWTAEGATISTADPTFAGVVAVPRKLGVLTYVTRELVQDATPDVLRIVEDNMRAAFGVELSRVVLEGSGANEQPQGLFNNTACGGTTLGGGSGAAVAIDDLNAGIGAVLQQNAEANAIFMSGRTWAALMKIVTGVSGDKRYLLQSSMESPVDAIRYSVLGVPVYPVNSQSLTQAPGGTSASIYICDTRYIKIVRRTDMTLAISEDVAFASDQIAIRGTMRCDVACIHPSSVYILKGVSN